MHRPSPRLACFPPPHVFASLLSLNIFSSHNITNTTSSSIAVDAMKERPRLLTIAPELRNRIYELVLVVPPRYGDVVELRGRPASKMQNKKSSVLSLLQACRQIYTEARGIFYHANHLQFENGSFLKYFLDETDPSRSSHVRTLNIGQCYYENTSIYTPGFFEDHRLPGLKVLSLTIWRGHLEKLAPHVRRAIDGLRGLEDFRIYAIECLGMQFTPQEDEFLKALTTEIRSKVCQPRQLLEDEATGAG